MKYLRVALAQVNTTVGDLEKNTEKILSFIKTANSKEVDIIAFPELALCGYPPEDLLLKPYFISQNLKYLKVIVKNTEGIVVVLGFPHSFGNFLYNSAAIIYNRRLFYVYNKICLPNYGVFDERRYFKSGEETSIIQLNEFLFGVNICEDIWVPEGPTRLQAQSGADLIINISASPYHMGKIDLREKVLSSNAKRNKVWVCYCNLVGGQDELVFDGGSMIFDPQGDLFNNAKQSEEDLLIADLDIKSKIPATKPTSPIKKVKIPFRLRKRRTIFLRKPTPFLKKEEEVYSVLVLGLKDYVRKNNFKKVVLGLSGGIDSSLAAAIAVDALGKENVFALSMPSRYSSDEARIDAQELAKNLDIRFVVVPIERIFDSYLDTLRPHFEKAPPDITEENIQARIRGNLLMAFSNKFGYLVLNTGNKSETSVGYCTLYGDMAGGFSVIKDLPKRLVYTLARFKNLKEKREVIPESIFKRPPTAELRPNQKDEDTLPPYDLLDKILNLYVEEDRSASEIIRRNFNPKTVRKVVWMVDRNEYKRRQSPPGIKITPKAFGKDRRMPITNLFLEA